MMTVRNQRCFRSGEVPPQHEHNRLGFLGDELDNAVGEGLPTLFAMTASIMSPDGEHRIQEEHAVASPGLEIAMPGAFDTEVVLKLFVDVAQRWWHSNAVTHRETQAVGLAWPVIRVLPENYDPNVRIRREVKRVVYVLVIGKHLMLHPFAVHKGLQSDPVLLVELVAEQEVPVVRHRPIIAPHRHNKETVSTPPTPPIAAASMAANVPPLDGVPTPSRCPRSPDDATSTAIGRPAGAKEPAPHLPT